MLVGLVLQWYHCAYVRFAWLSAPAFAAVAAVQTHIAVAAACRAFLVAAAVAPPHVATLVAAVAILVASMPLAPKCCLSAAVPFLQRHSDACLKTAVETAAEQTLHYL